MIIKIEDFLLEIGIEKESIQKISNWWNKNIKKISIYHLDFKTQDPIIGIYGGENKIFIRKKSETLPEFKLFILIHESFHRIHEKNGTMEKYFNLVKENNLIEFSKVYSRSEKEANDFAISSMVNLGFYNFINSKEKYLRGNEFMGSKIFYIMKNDIEKTGSKNFKELILNQIL